MAMVIALPHNHTVDYFNGDVVIIMFMKVKGDGPGIIIQVHPLSNF